MKQRERIIMLIDMQSFYASVEKAQRPEYKEKPLIVAGDPARRSGIVLAACPIAKSFGISTADRLWEALQKCPDVIVASPRMQLYIDVSLQITEILESYTDLVEPYSIDELFIDVTHSLHLFNMTAEELARDIQHQILLQTGVWARAGIAQNKILAKVCCDIISKKNKSGIFTLKKEELIKHIWPHPVEHMWSIGTQMKQHLNRMGIRTIGDLANTPLSRLIKRWGVNGQVIWQVANGIDSSPVTPETHNNQKVISNGMTLPRDYAAAWEIEVVILDLVNQVCRRCRQKNVRASVLTVSCTGADWNHPTGFNRQTKLPESSNITTDIYLEAKKLFHRYWNGQPIRRIGIGLSCLESDSFYQLTLFDDQEKKRKVDQVMDLIRDKFGETAIVRASSFTSAGQSKDRSLKIGGHYK
ncbi:DNA polymerase IV [Paenibacillus melissococcoides]|uniref:DNA polymerase IV n=1 Tax=Paenibacillus melissococcoides TaxID=2912268 RepID=A0ABM9G8Y5_9BACL|nr:DNA polymerase IV [Paenibacillus melissococcoides]CAH8248458.1 DNA polymerase IV [Paenibacillus melissococcoides]CAH8722043.1 DNA polymerase IV [Paenibacillus melissococcoides]CAH8722150.1 DNA polymerase IV [Paenibacillus melissococcoides]